MIEDKHDLKPNMMFSKGELPYFLLTYDMPKEINTQLLKMESQKAQAIQFVQQIQRAL